MHGHLDEPGLEVVVKREHRSERLDPPVLGLGGEPLPQPLERRRGGSRHSLRTRLGGMRRPLPNRDVQGRVEVRRIVAEPSEVRGGVDRFGVPDRSIEIHLDLNDGPRQVSGERRHRHPLEGALLAPSCRDVRMPEELDDPVARSQEDGARRSHVEKSG